MINNTLEKINYENITHLSGGSFGSVYLYEKNDKKIALKFINRENQYNDEKSISNEINILKIVSSEYTTIIDHDFEFEKYKVIALEYVEGGKIINLIKSVKKEQYVEKFLKEIIKKIFYCVEYIHNKNIVHCDLNYRNILFKIENNEIKLKLCDFGLSRNLNNLSWYPKETVGTNKFMAPEIYLYKYTKAIDIWSLGVLIYLFFTGKYPYENQIYLTFKNQINSFFNFKPLYKTTNITKWKSLNKELRKLISSMLHINYKKRISIQKCINHTWFQCESNIADFYDSHEIIANL